LRCWLWSYWGLGHSRSSRSNRWLRNSWSGTCSCSSCSSNSSSYYRRLGHGNGLRLWNRFWFNHWLGNYWWFGNSGSYRFRLWNYWWFWGHWFGLWNRFWFNHWLGNYWWFGNSGSYWFGFRNDRRLRNSGSYRFGFRSNRWFRNGRGHRFGSYRRLGNSWSCTCCNCCGCSSSFRYWWHSWYRRHSWYCRWVNFWGFHFDCLAAVHTESCTWRHDVSTIRAFVFHIKIVYKISSIDRFIFIFVESMQI
jgi:hypothetical protein